LFWKEYQVREASTGGGNQTYGWTGEV